MSSEAQRNVEVFERWLDEVIVNGNRLAEIGFISTIFTTHSDGGEQRLSRGEWPNWVERNRPPDWRLTVHDVIAHRDRVGTLFTTAETDPQTGRTIVKHSISILRFVAGQFAEAWIASRSPECGPWPNLPENRAGWSVAADVPTPEEAVIAAAMARYQEIRRTREAEGLRELFVDPMIVHGPGPTREENLDEFVRRVAAERQTMPGPGMEALDCLVAGNKAVLRWSYSYPASTAAQPSPIVGLTLYAFRAGRVIERWQAGLPPGIGW